MLCSYLFTDKASERRDTLSEKVSTAGNLHVKGANIKIGQDPVHVFFSEACGKCFETVVSREDIDSTIGIGQEAVHSCLSRACPKCFERVLTREDITCELGDEQDIDWVAIIEACGEYTCTQLAHAHICTHAHTHIHTHTHTRTRAYANAYIQSVYMCIRL
jgi:hypothetical protein